MGNWESWKMFKRLNGQENFGFALKTIGSIWEKTVVYQKYIFFLFIAIFVFFMSKPTVKVECRSTRSKSAAVMASDDTEGCKENNSSVLSHITSKCLPHIQVFSSSKLQSHSTTAFTVQWIHLVFIRSELLPAAERFVVLVSTLQCSPSCIHSPEWWTFSSFLWKNCLRSKQSNLCQIWFPVLQFTVNKFWKPQIFYI